MAKISLGIDIGGTNTVFGLVNDDGVILHQSSISTLDFTSVAYILEAVKKIIEQTFEYDISNLCGVGIGAPAANPLNGKMQAPSNINWKEPILLKETAEKIFNTPCQIDNDANATAIGELLYGNAKGLDNFIIITLGTGVGSGIVINKQLLHGCTGVAGELGHTIIEPNGRPCGCGRNGCLETYVAIKGILKTYEILANQQPELLSASLLKQKERINTYDLAQAADKGDALAKLVFDTTAAYLGVALANAVAFSSPQAIIVFGGIAQAGSVLMDPLQRHFNNNLLHLYKDSVQLLPSALPAANAALLGAAALGMQFS